MIFRYSSTIKPFISIRGLNIYPAPDYLLSGVSVFKDEDFTEGLVVETRESDEDGFTVVYPSGGSTDAKPVKPTKPETVTPVETPVEQPIEQPVVEPVAEPEPEVKVETPAEAEVAVNDSVAAPIAKKGK